MPPEYEASQGKELTKLEVMKNCCKRTKVWIEWLCHPESPPFGKYVWDLFFKWVGLLFILLGLAILLDHFFFDYLVKKFVELEIDNIRYMGAVLVLVGQSFRILGKHARRVELKTAVYNEEIDMLICEVEPYLSVLSPTEKEQADKEIKRLIFFKEKPSEVSVLRLTCLQKIQVDTYQASTLKAQANAELLEYKFIIGEEHDNYKKYEFIINDFICRNEDDGLREHLKTLRGEIASERSLAGQGEAILGSLRDWSIPAFFLFFFIGVVPLLSPPDFFGSFLSILNWGFLGITGAVLYTVNHMRNMDTIKVGEDEGNSILNKMLLGMVVGASAAILLYLAVKSGTFGGTALPRLNENLETPLDKEKMNALSLFWAIVAGFSAKFLEGLLGSSDKSTAT